MAPKSSKSSSSSSDVFFAPLNPDQVSIGGGLPDNFKGTVEIVRTAPWDYSKIAYDGIVTTTDKTRNEYSPAVMLWIKPDPDSELDKQWLDGFVQPYTAGKLDKHWPYTEDDERVDIDGWDGVDIFDCCGVKLGFVGSEDTPVEKKFLASGCNATHLIEAFRDAGFKGEMGADYRFLEGTYCAWAQLPQKPRKGLEGDDSSADQGGDRKFKKMILLPINVLKATSKPASGAGKAAGSSKSSSSSTSSTSTSTPATNKKSSSSKSQSQPDDQTIAVENVIGEFLGDRDDASLKEVKMAAVRALGGQIAKVINVPNFFNREFIDVQARVWELDADKGKMVLQGEGEEEIEEEEEETEEEA